MNMFLLLSLFVCTAFSDEEINAPFPMYSIREVKFTGGVPGATNFYSANWRPEAAFLPQMPLGKGWHSGPPGDAPGLFPLMIWYDFKAEGVRPAEVALQPAQSK